MASRSNGVRRKNKAVPLPIWQELLVAVEMVCLKVSPVYWGFGIPPGDGSAVVVVPGFMGTDLYLSEFRAWLGRIGYKPYHSKIGLNAECPNLLIRQHLMQTVESARRTTRKRVHLIGHSLGGLLARAVASQMPDQVASVITMGAPFRGISAHSSILRLAEMVRDQILQRHGEDVLPNCYTEPVHVRLSGIDRRHDPALGPAVRDLHEVRWDRGLARLPDRPSGHGLRGLGDAPRDWRSIRSSTT